jgi:hypothetical protein
MYSWPKMLWLKYISAALGDVCSWLMSFLFRLVGAYTRRVVAPHNPNIGVVATAVKSLFWKRVIGFADRVEARTHILASN